MELNEKGLWVRKKRAKEDAPGLSESAKQLLKAPKSGEDPRLEAAKPRGRGTADASEKALEALQERRRLERKVADELGMTNKAKKPAGNTGPVTTLNSSSQQCKPSKRHGGMKRWQGVQRTDEEAKEIVEKALGSCAVGQTSAPIRIEPGPSRTKRNRSPSPVVAPSSPSEDPEDDKFEAAWMDSGDEREAAKLNEKPSGGDVVVDFF